MDSLDAILVINLKRRPDRRAAIEARLDTLASVQRRPPAWRRKVHIVAAADGREIDTAFCRKHQVGPWPGWMLPADTPNPGFDRRAYHREVLVGEMGCTLSHTACWRRVVDMRWREVLILEDDCTFVDGFENMLAAALECVRADGFDLLYVGRHAVLPDVQDFGLVVSPGYSWLTHAYVVTHDACLRLLATHPERDLITPDEFLPATYGQHPRADVMARFATPTGPLRAFALHHDAAHQNNREDPTSDTESSSAVSRGLSLPYGLLDGVVRRSECAKLCAWCDAWVDAHCGITSETFTRVPVVGLNERAQLLTERIMVDRALPRAALELGMLPTWGRTSSDPRVARLARSADPHELRRQLRFAFSGGEPAINRYAGSCAGSLQPHTDDMALTVLIPLDAGFEGGGTLFWPRGTPQSDADEAAATLVRPAPGTAICFRGDQLHMARPVTLGVRHVLVASFTCTASTEAAEPVNVQVRRERPRVLNLFHQLSALRSTLRDARRPNEAFWRAPRKTDTSRREGVTM